MKNKKILIIPALSIIWALVYVILEREDIAENGINYLTSPAHLVILSFFMIIFPLVSWEFLNKKNEGVLKGYQQFFISILLPYVIVIVYLIAEWGEIEEDALEWMTKPAHYLLLVIDGVLIPALLFYLTNWVNKLWHERDLFLGKIVELENDLRSFVHPKVYEKIKAGQTLREKTEKIILMADIQGFTRFCEGHTAEEVHGLAQNFTAIMDEEIQKINGITISYSGDQVFALFEPDLAEEVIECAFILQKSYNSQILSWFPGWNSAVNIGIHLSDDLRLDVIGGKFAQKHYTANGFPICVVARVCSEAKNGAILITEAVKNRLKIAQSYKITNHVWAALPKNISEPPVLFQIERNA